MKDNMPPHIHHNEHLAYVNIKRNAMVTFTPYLFRGHMLNIPLTLQHDTQVNISSGAKAAKRGGHLQPWLHYKMGAVPLI